MITGQQPSSRIQFAITSATHIEIRSATTLFVGESVSLRAVEIDDEGAELHLPNVRWNSNDSLLVTVNTRGLVTAAKPGRTIVTACVADGRLGAIVVTVMNKPADELLFERPVNGRPELWTTPVGAPAQPQRLLPGVFASDPSASRDGRWIAFVGENRQVYVAHRDGSALRCITWDGTQKGQPCWAPDGTRLVFQILGPARVDIGSINVDGTGFRNLTAAVVSFGAPVAERPVWTPDGSRIVFAFRENAVRPAYARLRSMRADGSDVRDLVSFANAGASVTEPAYAPDGQTIAVRYTIVGRADEVRMLTSAGEPLCSVHSRFGLLPSYSMDGRWLVTLSSPTPFGGSDVVVSPTDGAGSKGLIGGVLRAVWLAK